ncbi:MAG: transport permease protein [Bryobacteraceae bacterium]|nr:MAG: transport permease protein [Bryobacteraceae bacterium]
MRRSNLGFVVSELILRDFRIRYRNMSLGVFWALLNPLTMVVLLTFVFTKIFRSQIPHYPLYVLCGLIPYNFFTLAWVTATTSVSENPALVKRVRMPAALLPLVAVLSNTIHLLIQLTLIVALVAWYRLPVTWHYAWLPVIWGLELIFIYGLGLATSSLYVVLRDVRYLVESVNLVLFWLVPIFYSFAMVPQDFRGLYEFNPVAALVLATQHVVLGHRSPPASLLWKMTLVACVFLASGAWIFARLRRRFYRYL